MANRIDLIGKRFNLLTVITRHPADLRWRCICDCGNIVLAMGAKLKSGHTKSCGCYKAKLASERVAVDYSGQKIGRLTISARSDVKNKAGRSNWNGICECGNSVVVTGLYLKKSANPSCGCASSELISRLRFDDLKGKRFSKLTVVSFVEFDSKRKAVWECHCDCGNKVTIRGASLVSGRTHSCGCAKSDPKIYALAAERQKNAVRCSVRRARKLNAEGTFTAAEINLLFSKQKGRCAWCHIKLEDHNLARDHRKALVNGGANNISNIELLCGPCNQRKSAKDEIVWANENGRLL